MASVLRLCQNVASARGSLGSVVLGVWRGSVQFGARQINISNSKRFVFVFGNSLDVRCSCAFLVEVRVANMRRRGRAADPRPSLPRGRCVSHCLLPLVRRAATLDVIIERPRVEKQRFSWILTERHAWRGDAKVGRQQPTLPERRVRATSLPRGNLGRRV